MIIRVKQNSHVCCMAQFPLYYPDIDCIVHFLQNSLYIPAILSSHHSLHKT